MRRLLMQSRKEEIENISAAITVCSRYNRHLPAEIYESAETAAAMRRLLLSNG